MNLRWTDVTLSFGPAPFRASIKGNRSERGPSLSKPNAGMEKAWSHRVLGLISKACLDASVTLHPRAARKAKGGGRTGEHKENARMRKGIYLYIGSKHGESNLGKSGDSYRLTLLPSGRTCVAFLCPRPSPFASLSLCLFLRMLHRPTRPNASDGRARPLGPPPPIDLPPTHPLGPPRTH